MKPRSASKPLRLLLSLLICVGLTLLLFGCAPVQRKLLYFPSHHGESDRLKTWRVNGQVIGFFSEVAAPEAVWLFLHGNAGQAADREYVLPSFSARHAVYILEYPGYGARPGQPSLESFNTAAREAYAHLRAVFPKLPIGVVGESIGTGPASVLASGSPPPDKVVLIVPFDVLANVASDHFPWLPTRWLLRDNWNNVQALASYRGPVEIFAAREDNVIRIRHARALAASKPGAVFHEIPGGHNDWSMEHHVRIAFP